MREVREAVISLSEKCRVLVWALLGQLSLSVVGWDGGFEVSWDKSCW